MRHVNSGAALARSSGRRRSLARQTFSHERLTPSDLNLAHETRGIWAAVLEHVNVLAVFGETAIYTRISKLTKREARYCPLEALAEVIVWCANRGISESRVRLVLVWLDGVVAAIYAGNAHPDLDMLDLEEQAVENDENTRTLQRRIRQSVGEPVSAAELEEEALANEREAAVSTSRARELRRRARLLSHTSVAATQGMRA